MHCSEVDETATGSANFWSAQATQSVLGNVQPPAPAGRSTDEGRPSVTHPFG
jgi:hypothetical protein